MSTGQARPIRDARLGTLLRGRYRLDQLLGRGGTGAVYRATDMLWGGEVAVKVLRAGSAGLALADTVSPEAAVDPAQRSARRFAREGRIVGTLNHPHIVKVLSFEQEDDQEEAFLAMELLSGQTLGRLLKDRHLSTGEALSLYRPLCDAMEYAHKRGIVHRDLKPDNVFLVDGRLDNPRVLDFGISKHLAPDASQLTDDTILGTPSYMAPELIRSPAHVDHLADIFALGAMLYHSLTGHLPFSGESLLVVLNKVLSESPTPARRYVLDLPVAVEAVLQMAMARNPGDRFQNASELADALESAALESTQPLSVAQALEAESPAAPVGQSEIPLDSLEGLPPDSLDLRMPASSAVTPKVESEFPSNQGTVQQPIVDLSTGKVPTPPAGILLAPAPQVQKEPLQTGAISIDLRTRQPILPKGWEKAALLGGVIGFLIALIGLLADR